MAAILRQKRGNINGEVCRKERVVVAVKASKEVSPTALLWALTHLVQPGDRITLLLVVSPHSSAQILRNFPRFSRECSSGCKRSKTSVNTSSFKYDLTGSSSHMICQLRGIFDTSKMKIKIKVISGSPCGAVAAESRRVQANWVVLDKQLKSEEKKCMEELHCNIVIFKHAQPKILRLNLLQSPEREPHVFRILKLTPEYKNTTEDQVMNPSSSPEVWSHLTNTEVGTTSKSSSPFLLSEIKVDSKKRLSSSESCCKCRSSLTTLLFYPWMDLCHDTVERLIKKEHSLKLKKEDCYMQKDLVSKFSKLGIKSGMHIEDIKLDRHVRKPIELSENASLGPPPLCSICKHKTTGFGKPPTSFSYAELSLATGGFSRDNFLAEGGFGFVYRGVLADGQLVAIKQNKLAGSPGDAEFCSEVEVLSCAQHRNVVKLIGFCREGERRLLVYEYVCNGSLNFHLYGLNQRRLEWAARRKIAVGAARGLRYLHEECRVGCIIHRA